MTGGDTEDIGDASRSPCGLRVLPRFARARPRRESNVSARLFGEASDLVLLEVAALRCKGGAHPSAQHPESMLSLHAFHDKVYESFRLESQNPQKPTVFRFSNYNMPGQGIK